MSRSFHYCMFRCRKLREKVANIQECLDLTQEDATIMYDVLLAIATDDSVDSREVMITLAADAVCKIMKGCTPTIKKENNHEGYPGHRG